MRHVRPRHDAAPAGDRLGARTVWLHGAALVAATAALACWWLYFTLYWPYRDRFDEAGRHFDESTGVVHHQQTGMLWLPAVALTLLAVGLGVTARARRGRAR